MNIKFTKTNIIFYELLGVLLLHLGEIILRFPCNHTDGIFFDFRPCVGVLALFEVVYSIRKREICILFWIVYSLTFTIPVIEHNFNILVPYEVWADRGMPSWGTYKVEEKSGEIPSPYSFPNILIMDE